VRPRAKVTTDSLSEVVHKKSIGTKMNDLDPFRGRFVMSTIASHSLLNILETVRNIGLVPKGHHRK